MTAPERPAPQEPTAQEHADTVRVHVAAIRDWIADYEECDCDDDSTCLVHRTDPHFDALLAEEERWLAWSGGNYPDDSPGDVIHAEKDGTITLDDGITTWNPLRALAHTFADVERLTAENERLREYGMGDHGVSRALQAAERERDNAKDALERMRQELVRVDGLNRAAEALAERRGDALMLADHLADRYGRYWAKDESFYRYMDARAALADEGQE